MLKSLIELSSAVLKRNCFALDFFCWYASIWINIKSSFCVAREAYQHIGTTLSGVCPSDPRKVLLFYNVVLCGLQFLASCTLFTTRNIWCIACFGTYTVLWNINKLITQFSLFWTVPYWERRHTGWSENPRLTQSISFHNVGEYSNGRKWTYSFERGNYVKATIYSYNGRQ